MFIASPPDGPSLRRDLYLVRAARRSFTGPADFLTDPGNRARVSEYLADMAGPYGRAVRTEELAEPPSLALGQSYGEMAQELIGSAVSAADPVDLLVLAFAIHDLRPGRQTAAFLSHITAGTPMAFAICDQGSAAAFSGLRVAGEYASSAGVRRALLIVVEQAALPYDCDAPVPAQHRGVAMLYGAGASAGAAAQARVTALRQLPGVSPRCVAALAAAELKELTAGRQETGLVLGDALAALWTAPDAGRVRVMPPGQPSTGVWWGLVDELTSDPGHPGTLVVADYDTQLRYLCLAAFEAGTSR